LGIVVGVVLIAAQTLVAYAKRRVGPEVSLGVVYMPGVLVVSTVWGLTLGAATVVLSIAAFDLFHVQPALQFVRAASSGAGGIHRGGW
jgi:K+-sensing histidine kinase KdpD